MIPKARKIPQQARSQAMVETILLAAARVLAAQGYTRTNTNLVAETAGISVGSLYQYFPNKDALIAALHERHSQQMLAVVNQVTAQTLATTLKEAIASLVHAILQAHLVEPELHRVLETEFSFYDQRYDDNPADQAILHRIRALLEQHQSELIPQNLDLATYMVMKIMESLVHAAVIERPHHLSLAEMEAAIVSVITGYLIACSK